MLQNGRSTGRLGLTQLGVEEGESEQLLCYVQAHRRGGKRDMEHVPCLQQMLINSGHSILLWSALGTDPKAIQPPRDMMSGALAREPGPRAH